MTSSNQNRLRRKLDPIAAAQLRPQAVNAGREGASEPRMLSIGLHLRMIGRPARIGGLETILRHIQERGDAWIARRDSIARHWLAHAEATAATCEAS